MGLEPDGDTSSRETTATQSANIVDPVWAAVDWTLGRATRTSRFWWLALGYFGGLFAWYAVQVHQTKYLIEIGWSPTYAAWALGFVSLVAIPGQIAPRPSLRPHWTRMGVDDRQSRLRHLLPGIDPHA